MKGAGHFRLFGTVAIGHDLYQGCQRVQCWSFKDMHYYGSNRQDFVFIRPPGIEKGGFQLSPDNAWYCKILLLFTIQTDMNGSTTEFECAFVSVMETMEPRAGDNLSDLRKRGLSVIYEINPKVL
jgi:hypothetical protein